MNLIHYFMNLCKPISHSPTMTSAYFSLKKFAVQVQKWYFHIFDQKFAKFWILNFIPCIYACVSKSYM
jgi:hypothetical protein